MTQRKRSGSGRVHGCPGWPRSTGEERGRHRLPRLRARDSRAGAPPDRTDQASKALADPPTYESTPGRTADHVIEPALTEVSPRGRTRCRCPTLSSRRGAASRASRTTQRWTPSEAPDGSACPGRLVVARCLRGFHVDDATRRSGKRELAGLVPDRGWRDWGLGPEAANTAPGEALTALSVRWRTISRRCRARARTRASGLR